MKNRLKIVSHWHRELYRNGDLLLSKVDHNTIPTAALNDILEVYLRAGTQKTVWYIAPFETDTTPGLTTTYTTPVFTECTAYDEETRQAFSPAAATGGVMTSSASKAILTCSATKTIYGAALVGGGSAASTKGDTAGGGIIFSAAKFDPPDLVNDDDIYKIWLEITLSNV